MRLYALLAGCILVIPSYTTAQTSAADGVLALVRGDAGTAVRILRPLAEDTANPDPLAAFFLALAYQAGGGGSRNSMQVCGLLMKAATPANPVMRQAEALATNFHGNSALVRDLCVIAARRGWGQPTPARFALAPDHRVTIDRAAITVDFRGGQKVSEGGWGGPGWQFLPTRLTEIETAGAGTGRRYFLESFVWVPSTPHDQPLWVLTWFASEIVGTDVVALPGDGGVARFVGRQPPDSFPVDDLARFVVGDTAQIDRVVIGEHARRVPIPSRSGQ